MKKIFISGIAGFLGSHLASFLIDEHQVSGIDNLIGGDEENVPKGVNYRKADCNDIEAYRDMLEEVDLVFHCAALAYEGLSVFSPHLINTNICNSTVALLSASINAKVKRFVFCSSMARYGDIEAPFKENMTPKPVDPYGISKYSAELQINNLCSIHGMEWNIAVPHNIIGIHQKYDDPYRNVASIMINRMLQGEQPIIYGDGNQMRCFSDVKDAIYCLLKLGFDESIRNEVVNIGPDEEFVTINKLATEISEILGFKLNPIYVRGRPQEVKYAICSSDKARKLLGYKTTYNLRESLEDMVEWIQMKGTRKFNYHLKLEIINELIPETWKKKLI